MCAKGYNISKLYISYLFSRNDFILVKECRNAISHPVEDCYEKAAASERKQSLLIKMQHIKEFGLHVYQGYPCSEKVMMAILRPLPIKSLPSSERLLALFDNLSDIVSSKL